MDSIFSYDRVKRYMKEITWQRWFGYVLVVIFGAKIMDALDLAVSRDPQLYTLTKEGLIHSTIRSDIDRLLLIGLLGFALGIVLVSAYSKHKARAAIETLCVFLLFFFLYLAALGFFPSLGAGVTAIYFPFSDITMEATGRTENIILAIGIIGMVVCSIILCSNIFIRIVKLKS